jgi:hypothetical protein
MSLTQMDILMNSLTNFYNKQQYINELLEILNSDMSLRVFDWFSTNYSKKNIVILNNNTRGFDIHQKYKLQLKSYQKKHFDPFCRKNKIIFRYNEKGDYIETSCGQLCFFKWCFENDIVSYVKTHMKEIEQDMKYSTSKSKEKKRNQLSSHASRSIIKKNTEYTISF